MRAGGGVVIIDDQLNHGLAHFAPGRFEKGNFGRRKWLISGN